MERVKRVFDQSLYRHTPLPDARTHIRLFRLLDEARSSAEVSGTLRIISFEDPPPYDFKALSYMCGKDTPDHQVLVDGKKLLVQSNLFDYLTHQTPKTRSEWLWIDAICISQHDLAEKGAQVAMMGAIYGHASSVVVWLGLPMVNTERALEFLNFAERSFGEESVRDKLQDKFNGDLSCVTEAVEELFRRPYWWRLWPVQEIVLASHIIVQCGRERISWDSLLFWTHNTNAIRSATGTGSDSIEYSPIRRYEADHAIQFRAERLEELHNGSIVKDLLKLGHTHQNKHCEDRRDRVYALLSMTRNIPFDPEVVLIRPDYRKTPEDVFFDVLTQVNNSRTGNWIFLKTWLRLMRPAWLNEPDMSSLESRWHSLWEVPHTFLVRAYPLGKVSRYWQPTFDVEAAGLSVCKGCSVDQPHPDRTDRSDIAAYSGLVGGEAHIGDVVYDLTEFAGAGFMVHVPEEAAFLALKSDSFGRLQLGERFQVIGSTHFVEQLKGEDGHVSQVIHKSTIMPASIAKDLADALLFDKTPTVRFSSGELPVLDLKIDRRTLGRLIYVTRRVEAWWKALDPMNENNHLLWFRQ